jgi:DnaA family protein
VAGANDAVVDHVRGMAVAARPGAALLSSGLSALAYLWGPRGSGKTHLLRALAGSVEEQGGRVGWFSAAHHGAWAHDEQWNLVVFDDCDEFDERQQHEAFRVFVDAGGHGTALAAAGRVPPTDLPLRDDLRSRLGWGQVFALQPLPEEDVRRVLSAEAARRRVKLSPEVFDYLLTRFERDLAHLMALLDRLDDFALASQRPLTVPLLKQMLAEESH